MTKEIMNRDILECIFWPGEKKTENFETLAFVQGCVRKRQNGFIAILDVYPAAGAIYRPCQELLNRCQVEDDIKLVDTWAVSHC